MAMKSRGFTLIELMIVAAILSILAGIAIPRFRASQMKARSTEVYTILGIAKQAEYAWFAQWDCFVSLKQTPEIGFPPGIRSSAWLSTPVAPLDRCVAMDMAFRDADIIPAASRSYHFFECERRNSPPDFTCNAIGDLDGDNNLSEFVYCTDHSDSGLCPASSTGYTSLFPFSVVRANIGVY